MQDTATTEVTAPEYSSAYDLLEALLTKAGFSGPNRRDDLGVVWHALNSATSDAFCDHKAGRSSWLYKKLCEYAATEDADATK